MFVKLIRLLPFLAMGLLCFANVEAFAQSDTEACRALPCLSRLATATARLTGRGVSSTVTVPTTSAAPPAAPPVQLGTQLWALVKPGDLPFLGGFLCGALAFLLFWAATRSVRSYFDD